MERQWQAVWVDTQLPSSSPSLPLTTPPDYVQVQINLKGKKLEHHGIRVEFVGQIEMFYDRGNHHDFLSLVRQLDPPGELNTPTKNYSFEFQQVEKSYETYTGTNVRLR